MNGVQKAAVLLISLGPEKSASIFKHLKDDEIEQLTLEIANTRSVSPQTKEQILSEFYEVCIAQQYMSSSASVVLLLVAANRVSIETSGSVFTTSTVLVLLNTTKARSAKIINITPDKRTNFK